MVGAGIPPATTLKVAASGAQTVLLAGGVVIVGGVETTNVTVEDVTAGGQTPDTITLNWLPF